MVGNFLPEAEIFFRLRLLEIVYSVFFSVFPTTISFFFLQPRYSDSTSNRFHLSARRLNMENIAGSTSNITYRLYNNKLLIFEVLAPSSWPRFPAAG